MEDTQYLILGFTVKLQATVVKTLWYWLKNRLRSWNRIENPIIGPHINSRLIVNKDTKTVQWRQVVFSTNNPIIIGC